MIYRGHRQYYREFWALKDVSFTVKRGETIGIIGRNGSGKSTLLQLICGTLMPTSGAAKTNGRVAALLELGAGFNPEFTGRENVYMNASILGLSHDEIDRRFDQIASFADIGDFIEQPVKSYSSGMYVRLAFAVIAHVDADILIIDEALSVGDAVFTQKCMRFIRNYQEKGTLIFVSHDMGSVINLCKKAIWLDKGKIQGVDTSKEITQKYLQSTLQSLYGDGVKLNEKILEIDKVKEKKINKINKVNENNIKDFSIIDIKDNIFKAKGWNTGEAELLSVKFNKLEISDNEILRGGEKVEIVINAITHKKINQPILGFLVRDRLGQDLFGENTLHITDNHPLSLEANQQFFAKFQFKLPMLPNGDYSVMASVAEGTLHNNIQHHYLHDVIILKVSSSTVRYGLVGIQFENTSIERI